MKECVLPLGKFHCGRDDKKPVTVFAVALVVDFGLDIMQMFLIGWLCFFADLKAVAKSFNGCFLVLSIACMLGDDTPTFYVFFEFFDEISTAGMNNDSGSLYDD